MDIEKILKFTTYFFIFLSVVVYLFFKGYLDWNSSDIDSNSIQGIDVSHHQKEIEWDEINKHLISFVYIKATEGGDFRDTRFQTNWEEARDEGFKVGAYHFFKSCKSGEEQANNFIQTVPKEDDSLPPALDLEFLGNCDTNKTTQEIIEDIELIEQKLHEHYGKKPIFYTTKHFYDKYLIGKFKNNPIWFSSITGKPKISDNRKWLIWQYSHTGRIKGIETTVDMNYFKGSQKEFERWVN